MKFIDVDTSGKVFLNAMGGLIGAGLGKRMKTYYEFNHIIVLNGGLLKGEGMVEETFLKYFGW